MSVRRPTERDGPLAKDRPADQPGGVEMRTWLKCYQAFASAFVDGFPRNDEGTFDLGVEARIVGQKFVGCPDCHSVDAVALDDDRECVG